MADFAVEFRGVGFRFRGGERDALEAIELQAREGERLAVIGLTGAGKSSLLRCVNRLIPASYRGEFQGRVALFGSDVADKRPAELTGTVGMVFQDFESQLFSTTAEMDVAFGPENLGLPHLEIRQRVEEALAAVGMAGLRRRDPSTLSGGQKQRLAMASVLSLRPRILCLDEPTTDLDPEGREEVAGLLKELAATGMTVLLAEHEPELLMQADRVIALARGRKVLDRPAEEALGDEPALVELGVRPPGLTRIARALDLPRRPHDAGEAAELITAQGYRLLPGAAARLEEADARRGSGGKELIRTAELRHCYPSGVDALAGVNLVVNSGEFVAILGRNGSGKTTLVKHLNGLLRPSQGAVMIEGRDAAGIKAAELGRRVGFVFQDPDHQIFAARVADEVAFAPRNYGLPEAEVKSRVERSLDLVGLGGYEDQDPFLLTKGERQRLALASILSADPEVLILDEPTTGLDYGAQRAVMDLLRELNRAGRTVIIITHAVWVAAEYAPRCVVMNEGRIIADGPTRRVLADPSLLAASALRMPEATAVSLRLGAPALTAEELRSVLVKEGA